MKRVSVPCSPASTRAMMRSTRLQLAAPSTNSLKRRTLPFAERFEARLGVRLQARDVPAQGRGRRQAEDEVDAVGAAPVNDQRTAIVAVGPDQDAGVRPVASDRPHEPAQVSADLGAPGPLGRPQHGADEPSLAVEHDDGLEAVFVVMGIEQAQLLVAMHGVEGIVDVEHDLLRSLPERGAVEVDQRPSHRAPD